MINSASIANFQSHKETELDFDPGVNVIIGKSDTGKSAIIRALKWLITNRPSGDSFITNGESSCGVEIELDDGNIIREKGKENLYTINEDEPLKAFGQDVPEEITKLLNINPIMMQSQIDTHFLFSMTPGEVAKHINKITQLDSIDVGMKNLKSQNDKINRDLKHKKELIEELEKDKEKYSYLPAMEADIAILENLEKEHRKASNTYADLEITLSKIKAIDLSKYDWITKAKEKLKSIEDLSNKLEEVELRQSQLKRLIERIKKVESEIAECDKVVKAKPDLERLEKWQVKLDKIIAKKQALKNRVIGVRKLMKDIEMINERLVDLRSEWDRIKPETCPLCGNEF